MKYCTFYKTSKSYTLRINRQSLQTYFAKAKKVGKKAKLIITIPDTDKEHFVLDCEIKKEKGGS